MKTVAYTILALCFSFAAFAQDLKVSSPNGNVQVSILLREKIYYTVQFKGERVLEASPLTLTIDGAVLGKDPKPANSELKEVREQIATVWGSRKTIADHYNQLTLSFAQGFSVEFRAYDHGAAYRFVTNLKNQSVTVNREEVSFRFNFDVYAWLPTQNSYETNYALSKLDVFEMQNFNNRRDKIHLPILVQPKPRVKVLITEAGLYDYPSMFLDRGNDYENFLNGRFEPYALTTKMGGFSNYSYLADQQAEYIARTNGKRAYPWRLLVISDEDRTFLDTDLVYQISEPSKLTDTGWIRPGKVAWDWWHDYVVEGENFVGGVNTATYLHHVDFAAKYGLEYILIDWLWTDKYDLTLFNPDVDLKRITDYAAQKGVRVIVWCPGHTLHSQLDKALDLFASYGVAGVKADFFGREDQTGIRMYEDIAKATAARKMLIDFHGCTKPTGLSRTYPNVINYEAVAGNEWNKLGHDLVTIAHKVTMPFLRNVQGPMDFTPGGMRNVQRGHLRRMTLPMVHGTRAGEAALFVLYNEPLKMLCDAPSVYNREEKITRFFSQIPTTWDETLPLESKIGEHLAMARQTGNTWYVAGLNGEQAREMAIDLDFLAPGAWELTLLKDGPNADRVGTDYLFETKEVAKGQRLTVQVQPGGGFVMHLKKK